MKSDAILLLALLFLFGRSKRGSSSWSDDDMRAFVEQLEPSGIPLDALLAVFASESNLNPSAASSSAWGLNQAQAPLLRAAGFYGPPSMFAALSVQQQLPYLAKMLEQQKREIGYTPKTDLEMYEANFSPAAARRRLFKIYSNDVPSEHAAYVANQLLDVEHKGFISTDDLARVLDRTKSSAVYQRALAQLRKVRQ